MLSLLKILYCIYLGLIALTFQFFCFQSFFELSTFRFLCFYFLFQFFNQFVLVFYCLFIKDLFFILISLLWAFVYIWCFCSNLRLLEFIDSISYSLLLVHNLLDLVIFLLDCDRHLFVCINDILDISAEISLGKPMSI